MAIFYFLGGILLFIALLLIVRKNNPACESQIRRYNNKVSEIMRLLSNIESESEGVYIAPDVKDRCYQIIDEAVYALSDAKRILERLEKHRNKTVLDEYEDSMEEIQEILYRLRSIYSEIIYKRQDFERAARFESAKKDWEQGFGRKVSAAKDGIIDDWFSGCRTKSDYKCRYRKLVKTHHPDNGGDADVFTKITVAYERAVGR